MLLLMVNTSVQTAAADRREDEAMDLYLFMAEYVRRSLAAFQGRCKPEMSVGVARVNIQRRPETCHGIMPVLLVRTLGASTVTCG